MGAVRHSFQQVQDMPRRKLHLVNQHTAIRRQTPHIIDALRVQLPAVVRFEVQLTPRVHTGQVDEDWVVLLVQVVLLEQGRGFPTAHRPDKQGDSHSSLIAQL